MRRGEDWVRGSVLGPLLGPSYWLAPRSVTDFGHRSPLDNGVFGGANEVSLPPAGSPLGSQVAFDDAVASVLMALCRRSSRSFRGGNSVRYSAT